jgi:hypothetical protein
LFESQGIKPAPLTPAAKLAVRGSHHQLYAQWKSPHYLNFIAQRSVNDLARLRAIVTAGFATMY